MDTVHGHRTIIWIDQLQCTWKNQLLDGLQCTWTSRLSYGCVTWTLDNCRIDNSITWTLDNYIVG